MGAEFVTFDNAVNAMLRIIRRCGLYGCTQNFLCLFYYLRIIRRADYRAEITVVQNKKIVVLPSSGILEKLGRSFKNNLLKAFW